MTIILNISNSPKVTLLANSRVRIRVHMCHKLKFGIKGGVPEFSIGAGEWVLSYLSQL